MAPEPLSFLPSEDIVRYQVSPSDRLSFNVTEFPDLLPEQLRVSPAPHVQEPEIEFPFWDNRSVVLPCAVPALPFHVPETLLAEYDDPPPPLPPLDEVLLASAMLELVLIMLTVWSWSSHPLKTMPITASGIAKLIRNVAEFI